jgi:DNA-binding NtrC family response regulator
MSEVKAPDHVSRLPPRPAATPIVFVVDDDISVRESLELLIHNEGWQPMLFESASEGGRLIDGR